MKQLLNELAKKALITALRRWPSGTLRLVEPDDSVVEIKSNDEGPVLTIQVRDTTFYRRVLFGGEVGVGESYVAGEWDSDQLPEVIAAGIKALESFNLNSSASLCSRLFNLLSHRLRPNSVEGSQRNIADHYDLSNQLFQLFLDPALAYSCAIFESPEQRLHEAQRNKFRTICEKIQLLPGDRVLEIGCGWGGFAIYAAREYGCHVTAITISREQFDYVVSQIDRQGLSNKVDVQYCDYRHATGSYDKIVSIEMFEAVGSEYWSEYFRKAKRLLEPDGCMLLQSIVMPDDWLSTRLRGSSWMHKYIFPGSMIPKMTEIKQFASDHLEVSMVELLGDHYSRTLRHWRERFWNAIDDVRKLGFDERFIRMWDYYLALCEASFRVGLVDDVQVLLTAQHCSNVSAPTARETRGELIEQPSV